VGYRERHRIPDLGVGVGFRVPHTAHVLRERPRMDWFEVISENFMVPGGTPARNLEALLDAYRVVNHGVSLGIGGAGDLDWDYLKRLKALVRRIDPPWCSDHLCWGGTSKVTVHDLLPLPHRSDVARHVAQRARQVQDFLEVPFALENVSSYLTYTSSTLTEWEFLVEVAERADCGIMFDVNNVFVSAHNHAFDPNLYVDAVPAHRVVQMHLAGHTDRGKYLLDTHSDHVRSEVWALYERAVGRLGAVSTLIEWDEDIPEWDVLASEASKARDVRARVLGSRPAGAPPEVRP
jgi:hypothetical protein